MFNVIDLPHYPYDHYHCLMSLTGAAAAVYLASNRTDSGAENAMFKELATNVWGAQMLSGVGTKQVSAVDWCSTIGVVPSVWYHWCSTIGVVVPSV